MALDEQIREVARELAAQGFELIATHGTAQALGEAGVDCRSVNKVLDKKSLSALIDECYRASRNKNTVLLADRLRTMGFEMSTRAGISICMDDMIIPDSKKDVLGSWHCVGEEKDAVDVVSGIKAGEEARVAAALERAGLRSGSARINGNELDNTFLGGKFADSFEGRGGNDILEADAGNDTAYFTGDRAEYTALFFLGRLAAGECIVSRRLAARPPRQST